MNLGEYTKLLKTYCKRRNLSDEYFFEQLITPIVKSENIVNKKGYLLYLDKSRVSRIMKHQDDVPVALSSALDKPGLEERMKKLFVQFYDQYIDISRDNELHKEFSDFIKKDSISDKEKTYILNDDTCILLLRIFLHSLKQSNKIPSAEDMVLWKRGRNYIKVISGDLFKRGFDKRNKQPRIIVIPVNTTFETQLSENIEDQHMPLVSRQTIHGRFLNRLYIKGLSSTDIKKRIIANLEKSYPKQIHSDYPIGSIASLVFDNTVFFLLAVSRFNKNNIAHSTKGDVRLAIHSLIKYYDEKGLGYDVYIPLIGTGLSRAYLSNQEAYDIIRKTLLENTDQLQGRINIVIHTSDINDINL